MTPNQELFDALFEAINAICDTYDTLPSLEAPYPFAVIGEVSMTPSRNKLMLSGQLNATLHFWESGDNRGSLATLIGQAQALGSQLSKTPHMLLEYNPQASQSRIIEDNSSGQSLWHGVLYLEYQFLGGDNKWQ